MRRSLVVAAVCLTGAAAPSVAAAASGSSYSACTPDGGATVVQVARGACSDAQALAVALAAATPNDAAAVLAQAGFTPVRAAPSDTGASWDLVAIRGKEAVRIRQNGNVPDLDGWAAGRELVFAPTTIVGGKPIPNGSALCTSAFFVHLAGGARAGLSAAHCGGFHSNGKVARPNVALRRPPLPGVVLGKVQKTLPRKAPVDALLLPIPSGRTAAPVVDRGIARPPWAVEGTAPTTGGRAVCFSGRTSGIDQCGRIITQKQRGIEVLLALRTGVIVRCTTIRAREGDSGGPVYTKPAADGSTRAVGIVTLIEGNRDKMCFTPITPALNGLKATIVTAG